MPKSRYAENMAQISSFLGLDFGHAKIGLAIADEETKMAFAFGTLKNDQYFQVKLSEIVRQKNVSRIIIGMTSHDKDLQGATEKLEFGKQLEKRLGIQVEFADEMFSTKMAHENLKLRGGKNIAKLDDQEAARIILQSWLDESAF